MRVLFCVSVLLLLLSTLSCSNPHDSSEMWDEDLVEEGEIQDRDVPHEDNSGFPVCKIGMTQLGHCRLAK